MLKVITVKFKVLKFCLRLIHTTTIVSYHAVFRPYDIKCKHR